MSVRDGFEGPQKQARGLNENYGRELLELHTLGVDGGYTQNDVREVARAFTGWSITGPDNGSHFVFRDEAHDRGVKNVLGHTIAGDRGMEDGEAVLDIVAAQPATARYIARKLCQRFISDSPPESAVKRVAAAFRATGGDLRWVYVALFSSPEFWSKPAYHAKIKTPFEFVVSAVRAVNGHVSPETKVAQRIFQLGEPLYHCPPPTGFKEIAEPWVSSGALVGRINFALALSRQRIDGVSVDPTRASEPMGVYLGSPGFQRR